VPLSDDIHASNETTTAASAWALEQTPMPASAATRASGVAGKVTIDSIRCAGAQNPVFERALSLRQANTGVLELTEIR